ncbi:MAG: hypothetical protein ABMB14_39240, partial [Myxococcota bacterium]
CRRLAVLDAIVCPEWELRYFSFDRRWDAAAAQRLGSMRDGCVDEWFAVFQGSSVFLRGFAHEAPLRNPPGLFDGVPDALAALVTEPAFGDDATFCVWNTGDGWRRGAHAIPEPSDGTEDDPDGSARLLAILVDDPIAWKHHADGYHELDVPLGPVARVYRDEPLTPELVAAIAPEATLAALADDLDEIGWPIAP